MAKPTWKYEAKVNTCHACWRDCDGGVWTTGLFLCEGCAMRASQCLIRALDDALKAKPKKRKVKR